MLTVVIAAHNEESIIGACLDALLAQPESAVERIIVCANGCTDRTAEIAATRGVRVIDRRQAGKPGALNAGDEIATGFPRIYLDADIIVPVGALGSIISRFDAAPSALAVVPRRRIETTGRPWPVRAYFSINERLPAFRKGLFGRGLIALSETGRARFGAFPDVISDDLFVDAQYTDEEKAEAEDVVIVVEAPWTTSSLVNRLVRVRRGNAQMRAAAADQQIAVAVRPSDRWAWLRDVVAREPRLILAAAPYVAITLLASLRARRSDGTGTAWGQDRSTRDASAVAAQGGVPAADPAALAEG
ncbi:glycosyltransferase family 2 protein [Microbacterium sp. NPDC058389]|uniref:glycosyltransferase family 2 protein n=1 Tax=Microbacterium sp. NPDC058389 TaxID=3346475 RepID=UPI00365CD7C7